MSVMELKNTYKLVDNNSFWARNPKSVTLENGIPRACDLDRTVY